MLHPSYTELMDAVNSEVKEGEQPIVSSRYSIVIAAAKRARQIIAGAESAVPDYKNKKPLSVAVEELMDGDVKILSSGEDADDEDDKPSIGGDVYDIALDVDDEDIFEDEMKEILMKILRMKMISKRKSLKTKTLRVRTKSLKQKMKSTL